MNRFRSLLVWIFLSSLITVSANAQSLPDFTGLVAEAAPAVVSVSATRTADAAYQRGGAPQIDDETDETAALRPAVSRSSGSPRW